jgi:hypothetical protein
VLGSVQSLPRVIKKLLKLERLALLQGGITILDASGAAIAMLSRLCFCTSGCEVLEESLELGDSLSILLCWKNLLWWKLDKIFCLMVIVFI